MSFLSRILSIISGAFAITAAAHANPANDQLSSMTEQQRRFTVAAFLVKSGERCTSVTRTFYQGSDKKGTAFWNAACTGDASFVIQVNSDAVGSTSILNCKVLKSARAGVCFTEF